MKITFISSLLAALAIISSHSNAQNQLFIPPLVNGPVFNLSVQADSTEFFTGHKTPTYGVNGGLLAPTLIFNRGETVTLNVTNNLNVVTTMHWHGLHVPAMYDGGPHQVINPGATWSPSFTVLNDAATFWYHPHGQNKTDMQVSKGIAGLIIVRDSIESALALPRTYGTDDFPLILQTKAFDVLYQVAIATAMDTVPMVNGTINPSLDAPAQVVRLRMLNGSSMRSFMVAFSNNMTFYQIATDGGLMQAPLSMTSLLLSPGERAEILVDLSALQGQSVQLINQGTMIPNGTFGAATVGAGTQQITDYSNNPLNGADYTMLNINVIAPTLNPVLTIPSSLVTLQPWNVADANYTRQMSFAPQIMTMTSMVEGPFTINGNMFDLHMINDTVYLNSIEIWNLVNQTMIAHPFHIHDVQFFVTDVNGGPVPDYMQGKKDVVLVPAQGGVSFITKFEDYADTVPYMYHCHLLHHEDDGMMGSFIVLDSSASTGIACIKKDDSGVYPNPVRADVIRFNAMNKDDRKYTVTNASGRIVSEGILKAGSNFQLDITSLPAGPYFINLSGSDSRTVYKFIRQ